MPTTLRRVARRALAAFSCLDRLFAFRSEYPDQRAQRTRLEMTPLEERVVPTGTQVNLAWLADGAEPGTPVQFRLTRVADQATIDGAGLAVALQLTGSAVRGTDYTVPGDTTETLGDPVLVTFEPGQSTTDLSLPVTDDTQYEGRESVAAQLLSGSDYDVGTTDPVSAWLADNELRIEADAGPILRNQEVTFSLPQYAAGIASVEWDAHYDGTTFHPIQGATDTSLTTTFATSGNRTVAARVTDENNNTQIVTLDVSVAPVGTAVTVEWVADGAEPGTPGTLRFTRADDQAEIDANPLTVTVLVGGTATPGADYTLVGASSAAPAAGTPVTVTFAAGQSTFDLSVAVIDDSASEGWESVTVQLQAGTGYTAATADPVTVWIADDELWLEADSDPVVKGQEVTFSLPEDAPDFATVEWDANYDGTTFNPVADATDTWFTTTFTTTGARTVAARVTDANGVAQVITLNVNVENPPPELTVPDDTTAVVGAPVTLTAIATAEGGAVNFAWAFSYTSDDGAWDFVTDPALTAATIQYTFTDAGEYDVRVTATDAAGKSSEGYFHVVVDGAAPAATVTVSGPTDEGQPVTFTLRDFPTNLLDIATVYVDWTGGGAFEALDPAALTAGPGGSLTFTHAYRATGGGEQVFDAVVWLEDDWGQGAEYTVPVTVRDVRPQATLDAGRYATTLAAGGRTFLELWAVQPGEPLEWGPVQFGSVADAAQVTFHWELNGQALPGWTAPVLHLPEYRPGQVYEVKTWVTDAGGTSSAVREVTVAVEGSGGVSGGPVRDNGPVFGTVALDPDGLAEGYGRFNAHPFIGRLDWAALGQPITVDVQLEPSTLAYAAAIGATVRYSFAYSVFNVERFTFSSTNHIHLVSGEVTGSGASLTLNSSDGTGEIVADAKHEDREINITPRVELVKDGVVVAAEILADVRVETIKTPTTWQSGTQAVRQAVNAAEALASLVPRLGLAGQKLVDLMVADPGRALRVLTGGFAAGIKTFADDLLTPTRPDGTLNPGSLMGQMYSWLAGGSQPLVDALGGVNFAQPETLTNFLLQYSGLTVDNVMNVVRAQLGAGNLAALEEVAAWFQKPASEGGGPITDVTKLLERIEQLAGIQLDRAALFAQAQTAFVDKLTAAGKKLGVQLASKFVPGAGAILSVLNMADWMIANQGQLTELFNKFVSTIDTLEDTALSESAAVGAVSAKVREGLQNAVPLLLGGLAGQFGLGNLRLELQKAVAFVPTKVNGAIAAAVGAVATQVLKRLPGQGLGLPKGILAQKEFTYQGKGYLLYAVEVGAEVRVELAEKLTGGGWRRLAAKDGLKVEAFLNKKYEGPGADNKTARTHMTEFGNAARELRNKAKATSTTGAAAMAALNAAKTAYLEAERLLLRDIANDFCTALGTGCFAAGTKLLTKRGWVAVELLDVGDEVAARHESEPTGAVEWKPIEATFRRAGGILHLHFPGGELIRTTPEHPFFVEGKGWTAAGALKEGDRIATLVGDSIAVTDVFDTEEWEPVYNIRVADFHTYFVGEEHWGWAAWAHNDYAQFERELALAGYTRNLTGTVKELGEAIWKLADLGGDTSADNTKWTAGKPRQGTNPPVNASAGVLKGRLSKHDNIVNTTRNIALLTLAASVKSTAAGVTAETQWTAGTTFFHHVEAVTNHLRSAGVPNTKVVAVGELQLSNGTTFRAESFNLIDGGGNVVSPFTANDPTNRDDYEVISTRTDGFLPDAAQNPNNLGTQSSRLLPLRGSGSGAQDKPGHAESNIMEYFLQQALLNDNQQAGLAAARDLVKQLRGQTGQTANSIQQQLMTSGLIHPVTTSGVLVLYIDAPPYDSQGRPTRGGALPPCEENCAPAIQALQYWLPNVVFLIAGGKNGDLTTAYPYVPEAYSSTFRNFKGYSWN